jgi:hypothetical protein
MTQKVVTNDEAVTGSKIFVVAIFGTFGKYITNLRGTFVENVKKSRKSRGHLILPTGILPRVSISHTFFLFRETRNKAKQNCFVKFRSFRETK